MRAAFLALLARVAGPAASGSRVARAIGGGVALDAGRLTLLVGVANPGASGSRVAGAVLGRAASL